MFVLGWFAGCDRPSEISTTPSQSKAASKQKEPANQQRAEYRGKIIRAGQTRKELVEILGPPANEFVADSIPRLVFLTDEGAYLEILLGDRDSSVATEVVKQSTLQRLHVNEQLIERGMSRAEIMTRAGDSAKWLPNTQFDPLVYPLSNRFFCEIQFDDGPEAGATKLAIHRSVESVTVKGATIHKGMSRGKIFEILGKPPALFMIAGGEHLTYWGDDRRFIDVYFENGEADGATGFVIHDSMNYANVLGVSLRRGMSRDDVVSLFAEHGIDFPFPTKSQESTANMPFYEVSFWDERYRNACGMQYSKKTHRIVAFRILCLDLGLVSE